MSTSPERCLGGSLMEEIDKELNPRDLDFESKETTCKTSDQKLSLDSIYSLNSCTPLSEDNKFSPYNKFSSIPFTKANILSSFNNQRTTILLQKSLMETSKDSIDKIIKEMSGIFSKAIKNKNGNYFCSDLFKVCNKNQRIMILKELASTMFEDCIDEYGTHPIQTLIELCSYEEEYKLILSSFNDSNKIFNASLNQNGFYVIQKIIVNIPEIYRMEFNLMFIQFLCILSMDMYGVCTVKKFIGYTKNELFLKQIVNIILTNFVNISENQYGNYLIQYVLEFWWNSKEGVLLKKLCIVKFHILASNHYSFYICDLFIKLSNNDEKKILLDSLIKNKTINKVTKTKNGNMLINMLMNSLRIQKDENK